MRFLLVLLLCSPALARDLDGRYADSPLKSWFEGLRADGSKVPCCDIADGEKISDVDWTTKDGHYQVRLDGKWIDVPDAAVVTVPNKFGPAVVWPIRYRDDIAIRCFMPGAGT